MKRRLALLAAVLLAGCAEVNQQPEAKPAEAAVVEPVASTSEKPKLKNSTLKYLANRNLKPQPTRALNARSHCAHKDAIGTVTKLDLLVKEAEVKAFDAQVSMKGYGTCRFKLGDFEQTGTLPQPLLRHKRDHDCSVRMWEQGPKVTIAFNSCPKACEGDAFSYLWPIMVEAKSGRCF
ncbi:MAG: hypothetical protein H6R15_2906 [Proteobacteria bacterium]|nr:hypothetical protein [Pseudomonadota bacterium]